MSTVLLFLECTKDHCNNVGSVAPYLSKACIFIGPLYVAALLFLRLVLCFFCLFYCLAD